MQLLTFLISDLKERVHNMDNNIENSTQFVVTGNNNTALCALLFTNKGALPTYNTHKEAVKGLEFWTNEAGISDLSVAMMIFL